MGKIAGLFASGLRSRALSERDVRAAMDRILNHKDSGVGTVYDRYNYEAVDKRITQVTAARLLALAAGQPIEDNVVPIRAA